MSQGSRLEHKVPYQGYPYARPIVTEVTPAPNSEDKPPRIQDETSASRVEEKSPYQGFPYVNRIVTDTRTLTVEELAAMAKWQNLPRRQLGYTIDGGRNQNSKDLPTSKDDTNPVVYIDLPEESTNAVANPSTSKPELDPDRPVVYIDIPQGSSGMTDRPDQSTQYTDLEPDSSRIDRPSGSKPDIDEDMPVVYIDIPENSESGVSQSIEEEEPAYVRDTILYDQFKNRRIELPQDSDSEGSPSLSDFRSGKSRPAPTNTLNVAIPGSSGFGSSTSSPAHSSYTPFQTKETYVYGQVPAPNDEFPLSPIPVNPTPNDYPAFPPPYQEIPDRLSPISPTTQVPQTVPVTEQQRNQVIINTPSPMVMDGRRKLVRCQHCNATVQTLVVEENGFYTHFLACLICLIMLPLVICVYCTDSFKYRNHYCPVCNKKIGYEDPTCCSNAITYVS